MAINLRTTERQRESAMSSSRSFSEQIERWRQAIASTTRASDSGVASLQSLKPKQFSSQLIPHTHNICASAPWRHRFVAIVSRLHLETLAEGTQGKFRSLPRDESCKRNQRKIETIRDVIMQAGFKSNNAVNTTNKREEKLAWGDCPTQRHSLRDRKENGGGEPDSWQQVEEGGGWARQGCCDGWNNILTTVWGQHKKLLRRKHENIA